MAHRDHHTGRHHQSVEHYERAPAIYRDIGHAWAAANTLHGLGRHDDARAAWRKALELYEAQLRDEEASSLRELLGALDGAASGRSDR
ncbi:tetratricopeptide repeat protein [Saccharothrix syringae]|uniref:tetratricopeptide repeat protein n=1 Tax=Saccharothrix syringae TaxID=103733 RepID=UPI000527169C|nr:tetratricopeptide repeat protein [Saccharothrix syringae]